MDKLTNTSFESIQDHVSHVRQVFFTGKTRDLKFRKQQLQNLYNLVADNEERFYESLARDMNKPKHEALGGDIAATLDECLYFIDNLDELAKDNVIKSPRGGLNKLGTKAVVRKDPLGVVLIIGSWNYPVQLALVPLIGAIAAGNTCILKLSEVSVHTALLITELFPKYMDSSCYRIVNGGVEQTTALLTEQFDHIFYTGNGTVGRIIMEAAAKYLTPVTLELGGKSPAVIAEDADMQITANRIAFGKFYNSGQICIAVDYVLVPEKKLNEFVACFKKAVESFYGSNPKESSNYARIVSERHAGRIANMITNRASGEIVIGGESDIPARYVAPTLIINVKQNDPVLMGDEIFGPVLPVLTYNEIDQAIGLINKREPPLALYIFSNKKKVTEKVLRNTQSGGVCVNDCLLHQAEYSMPFGGVGASGMGNYHGAKSYSTFTHERSMLVKKQNAEGPNVAVKYPPYTDRKFNILRFLLVKSTFAIKMKGYKGPLKFISIVIALIVLYYRNKK